MRSGIVSLAYDYLRLSAEEAKNGESSSIATQRMIIEDYCKTHGIVLVGEFVDDGYSGSNFNRPGFQEMIKQLKKGEVNTVITKDLSRLGRDMRESSYYAEQFFPEHGIRYLAIHDNFDTEIDNALAPFQFAMNEVYLRDGSRKVRNALKSRREHGQYCACPPYGYKKDHKNKKLIPDENTSVIVKRMFEEAAQGYSCKHIAEGLTRDGIITPLMYRVLYRDDFSDEGASRASDEWSSITVGRMLRNEVYLGHTILGKTKKASLKSTKKLAIPEEDWCITRNTHEPLVSEELFDNARLHLGKYTELRRSGRDVRISIFNGHCVCGLCGSPMHSAGTVYKGEREKYWFLTCSNQRPDVKNRCIGSTRIRYSDLLEVVRRDINDIISLTDDEINQIVENIVTSLQKENGKDAINDKIEKLQARQEAISKIILKLYTDNAEGKIDDAMLASMVSNLQKESKENQKIIGNLSRHEDHQEQRINECKRFFDEVKRQSYVDVLTKEIVDIFIDKIVIYPKILPEGLMLTSHRSNPFMQKIQIQYRFIGDLNEENIVNFPLDRKIEA